MIAEFKAFALKGNMIDLAVGLIVGRWRLEQWSISLVTTSSARRWAIYGRPGFRG